MFKNKNKIEQLTKLNDKLMVKKQKVQDRQNEENSRIENEMTVLQNLAFRNKQIADGKIAEIDRLIEKNKQLMELEVEFDKKIIDDQNTKETK